MIHLVQPGWYDDPSDDQAVRWWNGLEWSEQGHRPTLRENWRAWLGRSRRARRISQVLVPLDAVGALIALSVVGFVLIRQRPTPNVAGLLIVGIPLLAVGQLWMILLINSRLSPRQRGVGNRIRDGVGRNTELISHPIQTMFGGLSWRYLAPLGVVFVGCWLAAMTAPMTNPGSSDGPVNCRYSLNDHGAITCVSRAAYEQAGAGVERFAAGIVAAFFCFHLAAALGHLIGRRSIGSGRVSPMR